MRLSLGLQSRDCRGSITAVAIAFCTILASLAHLRQDVDLQKETLNFVNCSMSIQATQMYTPLHMPHFVLSNVDTAFWLCHCRNDIITQ